MHISEEPWTGHPGKPYSVHQQTWPEVDQEATQEDSIEIPVQVNGKLRDHVPVLFIFPNPLPYTILCTTYT